MLWTAARRGQATCPGSGVVMALTCLSGHLKRPEIFLLTGDDDIGDDDDMALECKKCGHLWEPMVQTPLKCPACNQPKWWRPKVRNVLSGERVRDGKLQNDDAGRAGSGTAGAVKRKGNGASLPMVRKAKSPAVGLHPVQPVRNELDQRGGHLEGPKGGAPGGDVTHAGHRTYKNGDEWWCSTCGCAYGVKP